jgi:hypothetical protein
VEQKNGRSERQVKNPSANPKDQTVTVIKHFRILKLAALTKPTKPFQPNLKKSPAAPKQMLH